jgi:protein SCO1/2
MRALVLASWAVTALALGPVARADQPAPAPAAADAPGAGAVSGTPAVFADVGVEERLNESIPADLSFTDSTGKRVQLKELLTAEKPVLLTLVYYRCPMLCNLVLSGMARAMKDTGLALGEDYRVITVSIDPSETPQLAAEKKRGYLQAINRPGDDPNWAFLVGGEQEIKALAQSVGFRYTYDDSIKQYAHSAVSFVLTPEGKISRYLYGVDYPARDVRLSMVEASRGRVGTSFDRVMLTCYRYDPATRRYGPYVRGFIRLGGLAIFTALSMLLAVLWRREIKRGTVS